MRSKKDIYERIEGNKIIRLNNEWFFKWFFYTIKGKYNSLSRHPLKNRNDKIIRLNNEWFFKWFFYTIKGKCNSLSRFY